MGRALKGCAPSISRRSDLQDLADRLDPVGIPVFVNESIKI
jgi:hypothetical protein